MKRFDRMWSERGRDGKNERQKRMELKIYFISTAFLKKGARCKRPGLVEERMKLTIIRSLGKRWLQFKKSCGSSSPTSFTFSTNCSSFASLLHFAAVPLLKSSSNRRSAYFEY